jgi:hypothetical protein
VTEMRDELLERVVDELRTLPPVNEAAIRRIATAASEDENAMAAARATRGSPFAVRVLTWVHSRVPLAAAAGFALAAGLAGYAIRGEGPRIDVAVAPANARAESMLFRTAASTSDRAILTQFVLAASQASKVSLVGDFNGWNADETPLTRAPASGVWTVTVPLAPGRHTYAFMVDGATWTLDPRAPTAQDVDFGTPSSVVLVGAP